MTASAILAPQKETPLILRKAAKAAGLVRYFNGKPCPKGHIVERLTSSGACVECGRLSTAAIRAANPRPARVLLTEAEKKARKAASDKRYRLTYEYTPEQRKRRAESCAAWREANPGRANEYAKARYDADPELFRAKSRQWRLENIEKARRSFLRWESRNKKYRKEYRAARHQLHRSKNLAMSAAWKAANTDRVRQYAKKYRKEKPEVERQGKQNRRARIMGNGGILSPGLSIRLMSLQKGKCACCRKNLRKTGFHLDHIEPLAKGGKNDDFNIQLLCPHCNRSKHARLPHEFMQSRGYLL